MISDKHLSWAIVVFFITIIALVFQQIHTSMAEQGIASGGPYNNGAAYPQTIAIAIGVLLVLELVINRFVVKQASGHKASVQISDLKRPAALVALFALYVMVLTPLGYHLTTTPMVFGIMWICGARNVVKLVVAAAIMAFSFAYIFEKILNVVLPGGVFGWNLNW